VLDLGLLGLPAPKHVIKDRKRNNTRSPFQLQTVVLLALLQTVLLPPKYVWLNIALPI